MIPDEYADIITKCTDENFDDAYWYTTLVADTTIQLNDAGVGKPVDAASWLQTITTDTISTDWFVPSERIDFAVQPKRRGNYKPKVIDGYKVPTRTDKQVPRKTRAR